MDMHRNRHPGTARVRACALGFLVAAALAACGKDAPKGPPPFSLEAALPALAPCLLDDAFLGNLAALKERAAGDPALAAAYGRFALAGLAAGQATGSPALQALLGGAADAAGVGRFLDGVAATVKGAPGGLPAAAASLASSWKGPGADLSAALAFGAGDDPAAPAVRALLARRLVEGLKATAPVPESERGLTLQQVVPGLPSPPVQDPRQTLFPATMRSLSTLMKRGAGSEKGLERAFGRIAEDLGQALGERVFPVPVSAGADPRPGTPPVGLPGPYQPLAVLALDAEGLKAGVRPTFGWMDREVVELSADPGWPGEPVLAAADLAGAKGPVLDAARAVVEKSVKTAEALEVRSFPTLAGMGLLSAERGDRGRPALVLAAGDVPAASLKGALALADQAGLKDLRLVPTGPVGRSLPVFFRQPPAVPGVQPPRGGRVLVVATPAGADVYPPAKATIPAGTWPEGLQPVMDGKVLNRLSVTWSPEGGFGGALARAVAVLREKVPSAPLVDVVVRSKDLTATWVVDASAEVLSAAGPNFAELSTWFPGLNCARGGACPSAVPVLFSDAAVPKATKAAVTVTETRPAGFCDQAAVKRTIMGRSGAYRACYEQELQRFGNMEGRLELRFTIEPDGAVSGVNATVNELNKTVEACVIRQVQQLKFLKPDGGICVIRWPFRFQPGG
jgi:hypothetical protein